MSADLAADFESDLADAVMADATEGANGLGQRLKDTAERNWRRYAASQGYDIEHIWNDAEGPFVRATGDRIQIRIEYPALTALFEWGVSPHTIEGNPLLAFHWASPPQGTRPPGAPEYVVAQEVNWGSVTGGIDASNAIGNALREVGGTYEPLD